MRSLLLLLPLCLLGCGGEGGNGGPVQSAANTWAGTWGAPSSQLTPPPGDTGTFNLTITGTSVVGTCFNEGKNETGTVSGTLVNGQLKATVDYPVSPDWTITPVYQSPLGVSSTTIQGNVFVKTEEYNRTIHGYLTRIVLHRQ
jgi:hypothetical protein